MSQFKQFKVEIAQRRRLCHNCGDAIPRGEACLKFNYLGTGVQSVNANLCRSCLVNIQEEIYQTNMGVLKRKIEDVKSKIEVMKNAKSDCNCKN